MSLAPWLDACPIVAILRGIQPDEVEAIGGALLAEGLNILEVPLNSPNPLESIRRLHAAFGDRALVGAGTVTSEDEVAAIARAGGEADGHAIATHRWYLPPAPAGWLPARASSPRARPSPLLPWAPMR